MPGRRFRVALQRLMRQDSPEPARPTSLTPGSRAPEAVLYRVLGNDHPPAQPDGSTLEWLQFLLAHEPDHVGLEKRWLLHRILDAGRREALIALLEQHGQIWHELPYEAEGYAGCWTDIGSIPPARHPWGASFPGLPVDEQSQVVAYLARRKTRYLVDRNAARTHALQEGLADAPWVFAWDASCFLPAEAWRWIRPALSLPDLAYVVVPTSRLGDVGPLLQGAEAPSRPDGLPLVGFSRAARHHPDPRARDGAGADEELLLRLGVGGFGPEGLPGCPWEARDLSPADDRARLVQVGWAYRLPGDPTAASAGAAGSGHWRRESLHRLTRRADMGLLRLALARQPLRCWTALADGDAAIPSLAAIAAHARSVPPLSVTDKPGALPGIDQRSYVNAVAHWQSLSGGENPLERSILFADAVPPGGDVARQLDRTRLQLMIDSVCALALDGHGNGNRDSIAHAHRLVRAWFLDPATAMIPDGAHARLSAVDPGRGVFDAALDFRDFYPLLDALQLLEACGAFSLAERQQLEEWFDAFLAWLAEDSAAFLRDHSAGPACSWYHLLMLSIAAYRGRRNVAAQVLDNLPGLLARQFRPDGSPRSAPAGASLRHEHLFNLQAWSLLVLLASALGRDLLGFTDSQGHSLRAAYDHAARHLPEAPARRPFEGEGAGAGDPAPLHPADWLSAMLRISHGDTGETPPELPPLPEISSGLPPFWSLCRPLAPG